MIRPDAELLLEISDLHASVEDQPILKGVNLQVRAGEIHAVMGRNGSGKSTLSKVLAGHPAYRVTAGSVRYRGRDLFELEPEERARLGVFLGFQYPVEIPGVSNLEFLRVATNARRQCRELDELDTFEFEDHVREKLQVVQMDPAFLERSVNEGFSGGEKKRNEILQMALLEPVVAILDETDSGLDIDALKLVAEERALKGSYIGSCVPQRDLPRMFSLHQQGKLPVEKMLTHRLSLDQINLAMDQLDDGTAIRQVIEFN